MGNSLFIKNLDTTDSLEVNKYIQFIKNEENDTLFFQSYPYINLINNIVQGEFICFLAYEDDLIIGALPLILKEGEYGLVANSLPFYGSYGGVITKRSEVFEKLKKHYKDFIEGQNIFSAVLVNNPFSLEYSHADLNSTVILNKVCQRTTLPHCHSLFDSFIKSLGETVKSSIRKAEKSAISVSNTFDDLDHIFKQHKINMMVANALPKPKIFFDTFPSIFKVGQEYDIYTGFLNREPISHLILFYHKDTVEYFIPVTNPSKKHLQALSLIIKHAMDESIKKGFKYWNWGTTPLGNSSLYKFKKKWGADDFYYKTYVNIREKINVELEKSKILNSYPFFYVAPF